MTIGYSEVLHNNYENHDLENSNAILRTKYNFTTIKIDGFEYLPVDTDVTDYRNPDNPTEPNGNGTYFFVVNAFARVKYKSEPS